MSLADFLKVVDEKLHDVYAMVKPDPVKARAPFLRMLEKTKKQFTEGKQPRGDNKWWSANNGVVVFSPNVDGAPIKLGGKWPMPMPQERFVGALDSLKAGVEAGDLDDQLVTEGDDAKPKGTRKARTPRAATGDGSGWSPERRARFQQSIEARKATKGA